jgi:hypothetical protein
MHQNYVVLSCVYIAISDSWGVALLSVRNLNSTCPQLNFWVTEQLEVSSNLCDLSVR